MAESLGEEEERVCGINNSNRAIAVKIRDSLEMSIRILIGFFPESAIIEVFQKKEIETTLEP